MREPKNIRGQEAITDILSSIPGNAYSLNYLLQITLPKTKNSAVSRLRSVPISITFHELHDAVETVSAWGPKHARYGEVARYSFDVFESNPLEVECSEHVDSPFQLRSDEDGGMLEGGPKASEILDSTEVTMPEDLSNLSLRERLLIYGYDEGFIYAIRMLERSDEDKEGKITCIGGRAFSLRGCGVTAVLE